MKLKSLFIFLSIFFLIVFYTNCGSYESLSINNSTSKSINNIDDDNFSDIDFDDTSRNDLEDPNKDSSKKTKATDYSSYYKCNTNSGDSNYAKIFKYNIGPMQKHHYIRSINSILNTDINLSEYQITSHDRVTLEMGSVLSQTNFNSHIEIAEQALAKIDSQIFKCNNSENQCIEKFIQDWGIKFYRRPLTQFEINSLKVYSSDNKLGNKEDKLKSLMFMFLISPQFVNVSFGNEGDTGKKNQLNQFELAQKLSFMIWGESPDNILLNLALNNNLSEHLEAQVTRLLASNKSEYLSESLVSQWFKVDKLLHKEKVGQKAGRYDGHTVNKSHHKQLVKFVQYLLQNNRPVSELVASSKMPHNKVTVESYQLNNNNLNNTMKLVDVSSKMHLTGGVISNAGLWSTVHGSIGFHIFQRGFWVYENLLCHPHKGLPDVVNEVNVDDKNKTMAENIISHAKAGSSCIGCHLEADPYGVALEYFDSFGRYRTSYGNGDKFNYDTKIGSTPVKTVSQMSRFIASEKVDMLNYCATKNILSLVRNTSLNLNFNILDKTERYNDRDIKDCFSLEHFKSIGVNKNTGLRTIITNLLLKDQKILNDIYKAK